MKTLSFVKQYLKDMVLKDMVLKEADEGDDAVTAPEPPSTVEGNDSLDVQVDGYLSGYEQEAAEMAATAEDPGSQLEHVDFRQMTREFLFEAPEDEQPDAAEQQDEEEPTGDEEGDTHVAPPEPQKKTLGEIDVRTYAESVSRLIENINSLIEVRNTVLRRAINHLGKTYDESVQGQLEIVLEEEFGLAVGKSQKDLEDEIQAPPAANAGPLGG